MKGSKTIRQKSSGLRRAEAVFSGESSTGGKRLAYNQGAYEATCGEDMSCKEESKMMKKERQTLGIRVEAIKK